MDTITITCGECGEGTYVQHHAGSDYFYCEDCKHPLSVRDLDLDPGESVTTDARGHLAYVTR